MDSPRLRQAEDHARALTKALAQLEAVHAEALEELARSQAARDRLEGQLLELRQELEAQGLEALVLKGRRDEVQLVWGSRLAEAEEGLAAARQELEGLRQAHVAAQTRLQATEEEAKRLRGLEAEAGSLREQLEGQRRQAEALREVRG